MIFIAHIVRMLVTITVCSQLVTMMNTVENLKSQILANNRVLSRYIQDSLNKQRLHAETLDDLQRKNMDLSLVIDAHLKALKSKLASASKKLNVISYTASNAFNILNKNSRMIAYLKNRVQQELRNRVNYPTEEGKEQQTVYFRI